MLLYKGIKSCRKLQRQDVVPMVAEVASSRRSDVGDLQYPPRVVLVIGDAAVALPSVHEAWVDARVVHGRCAGVQLTARNKLVDVGSIAAVVLLGLLLTPSAKEKPHASRNGEKSNNAHNNAGCDACCVGLALFFWSSRGCARGCLRRCCSGGCRARRFRGSARRGLEVFDLVQCFSGKDNPEFRGSTALGCLVSRAVCVAGTVVGLPVLCWDLVATVAVDPIRDGEDILLLLDADELAVAGALELVCAIEVQRGRGLEAADAHLCTCG